MRMLWLLLLVSLLAACGATESNDTAADGSGTEAGSSGDGSGESGSGDNGSGGNGSGSGTGSGDNLSARYPRDEGMENDSSVLFFDDFESGWGRWDWPKQNTSYLTLADDATRAHSGNRYLRSTVTEADLRADSDGYISSSAGIYYPRKTDQVFIRFYAQFVGIAPNPHHWIKFTAEADGWNSGGRAGTLPPGDKGFWSDLDINNNDQFNFYAYWHKMRSGRCNDGSVTPGCAGDQGTTYYYGNVFKPAEQTSVARDEWVCLEIQAKANEVGQSDGELALWMNDTLVGHYRPGSPLGTWLRATFYNPGECTYSACSEPQPFEGFDFRSSPDVQFNKFILDAYYQLDTYQRKRQALIDKGLNPSDQQTILYDDVVVATQRVGCRVD